MFLLGPAGSGKSCLIKGIARQLQQEGKGVAMTCSTGIACDQVGGITLHKWCGFGHRVTTGMPMDPATRDRSVTVHTFILPILKAC